MRAIEAIIRDLLIVALLVLMFYAMECVMAGRPLGAM